MTSLFDQSETSFDEVDRARRAEAFSGYLTRAAADLADVKAGLHDQLAPRPDDRVLDVGCGTGTDVMALASRVLPGGRVVGVDNSQLLVNEARTLGANSDLPVEFEVCDAHALPFPDDSFDAARGERVMMHVADPARAIGELVRVTRPGGRVLVADPDHGMWAPDLRNLALTRSLLHWWFDFIANPWIARQMPALFHAAGLRDVGVSLSPIVFPDLEAADALTGITRTATMAAQQGVITEAERDDFDEELRTSQREGRFFMCGVMIVTTGQVPEPA